MDGHIESCLRTSFLPDLSPLMGEHVIEKIKDNGVRKGNLPFLFKVPGIDQALSIQTRPRNQTFIKVCFLAIKSDLAAEHLGTETADPNHQPEMALVITPFQPLCGFRPVMSFPVHIFLSRLPSCLRFCLSNSSNPESQEP